MRAVIERIAFIGAALLVSLSAPDGAARVDKQSTSVMNPRLQEGASFVHVRSRLIKSGWKPVRMHVGDRYDYEGTEKRLADRNIIEVDSCSTDRGSLCIFYYAKDGMCLRIDTLGEQVDAMRVTRWDDSCPNEPPQPTTPPG
jgi:hypothetical protein